MHEDVLQAICLHYIGVKWSVFFKKAFIEIHRQDAWKSNRVQIPKTDRLRRQYFLGSSSTQENATVDSHREDVHRKRYFAHQLLDHDTQQIEMAEGEEEAEFGDHVQASKKRKSGYATLCSVQKPIPATQGLFGAARQSTSRFLKDVSSDEEDDEEAEDEDVDNQEPKRPMKAKQDILHLLSTEIIINSRLNGELSCFHSVFESWNPLLPHQTVLEILSFFGVSGKWQAFFTKFLQAPLKFIEDGPSVEPRLRKRGIPGSHSLSDMLGETVFFCLDFAVNQTTDGALFHRLYDDIWFWNKDYEKCVQAWDCVKEFTKIMGVQVRSARALRRECVLTAL
jgi:hypothetical protein